MAERLALYTTVYPAVEPYLAEWYASVRAQSDGGFDIWVGVDAMTPERVIAAMGAPADANIEWVIAHPGDSPARIRHDALSAIAERYDGVVLVDSDDVLEPARVAAAREALRRYDVSACALRIMDGQGRDTGIVFATPCDTDPATLLPRWNVFGLSNTAYRCGILKQCLPIPDDCDLPDWLLATRAWCAGATLAFDRTPHMRYRQYDANVARVLTPFSSSDVQRATERVLSHYRAVLADLDRIPGPLRRQLGAAREDARAFHRAIVESPNLLSRYVDALNALPPRYMWWWCVANPELEDVWKV
ncbi:MAG TPA: hypothetical protein VIC55_07140 [Gemmatimonadaceae bacterium]|jgi:hypothetical protein